MQLRSDRAFRLLPDNDQGHPARTDRFRPIQDQFEGSGGPIGYRGVPTGQQRSVSGRQWVTVRAIVTGGTGCGKTTKRKLDRASPRATAPANWRSNAKRSSAGTKNVSQQPRAAASIPYVHHDRASSARHRVLPSASRLTRLSRGNGSDQRGRANDVQAEEKTNDPSSVGSHGYPP